jgi:hypothetical protein
VRGTLAGLVALVALAASGTACVGIFGPLSGSRELETVQVGEDVSAIGMADLGGETPDVLLVATTRLQLDVHVGDKEWNAIGAAYTGVDPPTEITPAEIALDFDQLDEWELNHLGYTGTPESNSGLPQYEGAIGQPENPEEIGSFVHINVVLAQLSSARITMLRGKINDPHHMDFPVQVYRSHHGGLTTFTVADIDQDGIDELIAAETDTLSVTNLVPNLFADAEHPVSMSNTTDHIDDSNGASALATKDIDGDGWIDVLATGYQEPVLRVYFLTDNGVDRQEFDLPGTADAITTTECDSIVGFVKLTDGTVVSIPRSLTGTAKSIGTASHIASTPDQLVLAEGDNKLDIFDECGNHVRSVEANTTAISDIAIHHSSQLLAVLDADAHELKLFTLE